MVINTNVNVTPITFCVMELLHLVLINDKLCYVKCVYESIVNHNVMVTSLTFDCIQFLHLVLRNDSISKIFLPILEL